VNIDRTQVLDLDTHRLPERRVVRTFVHHATVRHHDPRSVELDTTASIGRFLSRGDDRGQPSEAFGEGDTLAGTYRIDLVAPGTVRLRYAEGPEVPVNHTPMLAVDEVPATDGDVEVDADRVTMRTAALCVEVDLQPLTLTVRDAAGDPVAVIGGKEKNGWSLWDTYNTGISRTMGNARPVATETFSLRPHEAVYGFGERFCGLDKRGQTLDLCLVEPVGTTTPRAYKPVPFFVSTAGYGVFVHHSAPMTAWVGSLGAADVQLAVADDFYDLFVFVGDIPTVLSAYTEVTGKAAVPPDWSFGFWQSKISYSSAAETLELVGRYRDARLPVDVVHLDTHWYRRDWFCDLEFDPERFPDPEAYFAEMAEAGVHVSLWQLPYVPEGSAYFDELAAVDGFVRNAEGAIYDVGLCYTPGWEGGTVGCIDFTNPAAVAVYQRRIGELLTMGAAAIKVDFGEEAPIDGVYFDGTPGHRAHNLYPLLYNRAVAEVTRAERGEDIIWARSTWAGSQRYPLHWGGDSTANWDNLGPQIAGGLSLGLCGFSFWSQDIGGFLGEPEPELLIRWMQAGLFLSHARIHGFGTRELDRFGDEAIEVFRRYLDLRMRLLPYLLGTADDSAARSLPMARALVVDHQQDPSTWGIADQWMLGSALLVAPILDDRNRRRVYLPAGAWTDWWTGEVTEGGRWIEVEAPLDTLPLWLAEGAAVALGPVQQHVGETPCDPVEVRRGAPCEHLVRTPARIDGQLRWFDNRQPTTREEVMAMRGAHAMDDVSPDVGPGAGA
jgi:alpha-D-xyloside xylohydrolase